MKSKQLIFLIIFAVGAVYSAAANTDAASQNAPVAVVPEDIYRFEPVAEGTQVTYEFKIQNQGTAPLRIEKVNTG